MVYNEFIKCEVCGCVTRIRLQVGWLDEHPIAVTCGKCGISLKGKVKIGQEIPELKFKFENAEMVNVTPTTLPDYVVECSGEFPTIKMCEGWVLQDNFVTPFIRYQQKITDFDNYKDFGRRVATLKHTINIWPQYKRVLQLYKGGNWEYLTQEIKKIFPEDFIMCRNELEIIRAVRMIEVHGFLLPLKPEIISLPEIGSSILKLEKEQINSFIEYLNSHDGYGLNQMQEQINVLLGEFIETFPYLVPAFSLQFCEEEEENIDFETEGTTTSTYDDVKQFYLDTYETLGNLLIIPIALDNIKIRNDFEKMEPVEKNISSIDEFVATTKATRFHYISSNEPHVVLADITLNAKLRNAIGHNDVEYDTVTQCITYIPNPKDRSKRNQEYLLQFENEALRMFQGVLVISEYIYRLRQLTLMEKGITPIRPNVPIVKSKKIGRNEPCPCGSGKKFKHCHGRNG